MSLKNKCHAHKPEKGKGSYTRERLAEMEQMIVDSTKVSLYLDGIEITDDEWDKMLELHEIVELPQSLLDKMEQISVKLDLARKRHEEKK